MTASLRDFYKNKRVLITGHTGFKGSWLSLWLSEIGAEVIGFSLDPPTNPSHFEICGLKKRMVP
ncbi:CDP-glucose 4,6-dehydratase, partial [bacterium]|nr:CDP-glucose 4,6-dehydratase [bacterium]